VAPASTYQVSRTPNRVLSCAGRRAVLTRHPAIVALMAVHCNRLCFFAFLAAADVTLSVATIAVAEVQYGVAPEAASKKNGLIRSEHREEREARSVANAASIAELGAAGEMPRSDRSATHRIELLPELVQDSTHSGAGGPVMFAKSTNVPPATAAADAQPFPMPSHRQSPPPQEKPQPHAIASQPAKEQAARPTDADEPEQPAVKPIGGKQSEAANKQQTATSAKGAKAETEGAKKQNGDVAQHTQAAEKPEQDSRGTDAAGDHDERAPVDEDKADVPEPDPQADEAAAAVAALQRSRRAPLVPLDAHEASRADAPAAPDTKNMPLAQAPVVTLPDVPSREGSGDSSSDDLAKLPSIYAKPAGERSDAVAARERAAHAQERALHAVQDAEQAAADYLAQKAPPKEAAADYLVAAGQLKSPGVDAGQTRRVFAGSSKLQLQQPDGDTAMPDEPMAPAPLQEDPAPAPAPAKKASEADDTVGKPPAPATRDTAARAPAPVPGGNVAKSTFEKKAPVDPDDDTAEDDGEDKQGDSDKKTTPVTPAAASAAASASKPKPAMAAKGKEADDGNKGDCDKDGENCDKAAAKPQEPSKEPQQQASQQQPATATSKTSAAAIPYPGFKPSATEAAALRAESKVMPAPAPRRAVGRMPVPAAHAMRNSISAAPPAPRQQPAAQAAAVAAPARSMVATKSTAPQMPPHNGAPASPKLTLPSQPARAGAMAKMVPFGAQVHLGIKSAKVAADSLVESPDLPLAKEAQKNMPAIGSKDVSASNVGTNHSIAGSAKVTTCIVTENEICEEAYSAVTVNDLTECRYKCLTDETCTWAVFFGVDTLAGTCNGMPNCRLHSETTCTAVRTECPVGSKETEKVYRIQKKEGSEYCVTR